MLPLPFSGGQVYAATFWIAFMLWMVPEMIASRIKRAPASSNIRDRGSMGLLIALTWVGMGLDFFLSFQFPNAAMVWLRRTIFLLGIGLILAGTVLRWYAIAVLGRHFTFDVAVHAEQTVIDAGPYRHVRHPAYTGTLLTLIGLGLGLGNWAGIIALLGCVGIGYAYRISVEEAALIDVLGEQYQRYMRRTWCLIPFLF